MEISTPSNRLVQVMLLLIQKAILKDSRSYSVQEDSLGSLTGASSSSLSQTMSTTFAGEDKILMTTSHQHLMRSLHVLTILCKYSMFLTLSRTILRQISRDKRLT